MVAQGTRVGLAELVSPCAAVGLYSVLLLVSLYNYYFTPRFGREQWREAVAYIESQDSGKTVIVFDAKLAAPLL